MQHLIYGPRRRRSDEPRGVTTDPPLVSGEPIREWAFSELRGDSLEEVERQDQLAGGPQVPGLSGRYVTRCHVSTPRMPCACSSRA